jgi:hypothetical protein
MLPAALFREAHAPFAAWRNFTGEFARRNVSFHAIFPLQKITLAD